jgi:hypothetical protein
MRYIYLLDLDFRNVHLIPIMPSTHNAVGRITHRMRR